jgi:hypothetical protein
MLLYLGVFAYFMLPCLNTVIYLFISLLNTFSTFLVYIDGVQHQITADPSLVEVLSCVKEAEHVILHIKLVLYYL